MGNYLRILENILNVKWKHNYAEQIAVTMEYLREKGTVVCEKFGVKKFSSDATYDEN